MFQAPFIVLDGIDGTGKSTQARLLVEWLHGRGISAVPCTDPGSTPLGKELRRILLEKDADLSLRAETMLFMASRAEMVEKIIRPCLENGVVVVCDRFLVANVAYQAHAGGLDPEEIWRIGDFATCGLEPDITFLFDLPVDAAEARRNADADRFEARDRDYHERVREGFLYEASQQPEKYEIIDASPPVEVLQQLLRDRVLGLLIQRGLPLPGNGS